MVSKSEFDRVFSESVKISQKHILALFKRNPDQHGRLGIVVGKRVAKKAISRNRIKRVIRESFRLHQKKLVGWDIVVVARQQIDSVDHFNLRKGVDELWERLTKQYPNLSS